jgi:MMP 1-O-methyltransferase
MFKKVSNHFIDYKIRKFEKIQGWLSRNEARELYRFSSKLPRQGKILEIGCWKGKSTYCLAEGLVSGQVIVIDPFDATGENGSKEIYQKNLVGGPLIEQFRKMMIELKVLNKIRIVQGLSDQFVGQFQNINMLFIDGNHSIEWCQHDFLNYSPELLPSGYLLFHDYDDSRKELGPTWVVENIVNKLNGYKFIGLYDSLWVAQKI